MDSKKRKEKLLNQINKDKRPNMPKSDFKPYQKGTGSKAKKEAAVKSFAKGSKPKKEAKPAYTNDEALMSKIAKEKKAYKSRSEKSAKNGFDRFKIRATNKWNAKSDQDKYKFIGAWVIVLLIVIIVGGLLISGVFSNKKSKKDNDKIAEETKTTEEVTEEEATTEFVDDNPLKVCDNTDVKDLIVKYFTALRDNDIETLKSLDMCQTSYESSSSYNNISKVIEDYTNLDVFTMNGPYDGGYLAYVVTDIKFKGVEHTCQGMYRIVVRRDGSEFKVDTTPEDDIEDDDASDLLTQMSLKEDVLELYDKVNAQAQADLEADAKLKEYVTGTLKGSSSSSGTSETASENATESATATE